MLKYNALKDQRMRILKPGNFIISDSDETCLHYFKPILQIISVVHVIMARETGSYQWEPHKSRKN